MQLLEHQLPEFHVPSRRAPVRLQDITSFEGAFLSNARGVAAVGQVDDASLPIPAERMKTIADAYASATWDNIRPDNRRGACRYLALLRRLPRRWRRRATRRSRTRIKTPRRRSTFAPFSSG